MAQPEIKLSKEDIRNGWTKAKLKAYLKEREDQRIAFELEQGKVRKVKVENVHSYNPHTWRA